ncbi:APC family permease [Sphingomonas oryzagri]|uniref:Arginine/agmatine antiporter n=1 Tax=Sphingomonas oryzagri TaxID=3042314 RepID=A0ABT6N1Q9_9SPHN|nr:APC family permease [Sphingomonas oryzagri]MDH7638996.1 APC family permease [Sphingomonas oryzagri]
MAGGGATRDEGLDRGIGSYALATATVNAVIGAGIFSLPAGMARAAGPYALVAYLLCALAMAAVVLCFAEAGSRVPTSGGPYGYVGEAFGPMVGLVAGILTWLGCVLAAGGIAAGLADALAKLVPQFSGPVPRLLIIVGVLGGLAGINLLGVRTASRLLAAGATVKLVPLLLFVGIGLFFVDPHNLWAGTKPDAGGIGRAVLISLFTFQGMETSLGASGEVRDPARTLPRALVAAMAFVTLAYMAIQWVAQGLLGGALGASKAPLADAMALIDPRLGLLLLIGTALSMAIWLGSDLLGAPRLLFAFARDGFLPAPLARLSKRQVPANAIIAHAVIGILLATTGTFEELVVLAALASCALYIAGCLAAWRLRARDVAQAGTPVRLPLLGLWVVLGAGSMLVAIALGKPAEIGGLIAVILASMLLYAVVRR